MVRFAPFIRSMPERTLASDTTEDPAMFTRFSQDSFSTRVLASVIVAATVMLGSLGYAVANIQVVA